jgi:hypothetical protein
MLCSGSVIHGAPNLAAPPHAAVGHRAEPQLGPLRDRADLAGRGEVLTVVAELGARPGLADQADGLLEPGDLGLAVDAVERELLGQRAQAAAQPHPAAGDHVDHGGLLGDLDRVVVGEQEHGGPDVHPLGARRQRAAGHQRGGQVAVRHHVVLGHEDAVEPGLLGCLRGVQGFLPAPADVDRVRRVLRAEQQTEFHRATPPQNGLSRSRTIERNRHCPPSRTTSAS